MHQFNQFGLPLESRTLSAREISESVVDELCDDDWEEEDSEDQESSSGSEGEDEEVLIGNWKGLLAAKSSAGTTETMRQPIDSHMRSKSWIWHMWRLFVGLGEMRHFRLHRMVLRAVRHHGVGPGLAVHFRLGTVKLALRAYSSAGTSAAEPGRRARA